MVRIISRVAFCKRCYESERPQDGNLFSVHGSGSKTLKKHEYTSPEKRVDAPPMGYVPHFFMREKDNLDGTYQIIKCCGIENCGISYETKNVYGIEFIQASELRMTYAEWYTLVKFSDSGYKLPSWERL